MRRRTIAGAGVGATLLTCLLVGSGGYWLLDAIFNPRPHADTRLRAYLAAVQAGDWATAAEQVDHGTYTDLPTTLRTTWAACMAVRGRIDAVRVSSRPLDFGHATATIRFADGTHDRWSVYMNPKRGPGWKLTTMIVPPTCRGQPPDAGLPPGARPWQRTHAAAR